MQSLITSYLLQSKECILPGIGILKIITTPASTDHENNNLLPPFQTIIFNNATQRNSPGLVKYISNNKHIQQSEAEDILDTFCNEWKEKINAGEKLNFETIGYIFRNTDGAISFQRENSNSYLKPIAIDNTYKREEKPLIHEEAQTVDEETSIPETNVITEDVVVERSYWGLWALILIAIGSVMLFYHFKDHKLTGASMGNQHHYTVDTAIASYKTK